MMRAKHYLIVVGACIGTAAIVAPFSYDRGRGPDIRIQKVQSIGPAIMGQRLEIRVWGDVRPGCLVLLARSFSRWQDVGGGMRAIEKQPLANNPTVSSSPPVPDDLKGLKPAPFSEVFVPLPNKLAPGTDWYLMGEASPLYCEPWWRRIWGVSKPQSFAAPTVIAEAGAAQ